MRNRKEEIEKFAIYMDEKDESFFEGYTAPVEIFIVYGGKWLEITFCPEITEKIREVVAVEKEIKL